MLDWDDLRFLLALHRRGSLSAAARDLGVTQSTVGRRLASLEAALGTRLMHRTPDGYLATGAGEAVLGRAEAIEAHALIAERSSGGEDARLEGTVRVAAAATLAGELLIPCIAALQARHPGIDVDLIVGAGTVSLAMREADLALRVGAFQPHELVVRRVGALDCALYATPAYLARFGTPEFGMAAPDHRVIAALDPGHAPEWERWLGDCLPEARVALRADLDATRLVAACSGVGIACLARLQGDAAVAAGRLCRLTPTPAPPAPLEIWLAVHRDNRGLARVRLVHDAIVAALRDAAGRLHPRAP